MVNGEHSDYSIGAVRLWPRGKFEETLEVVVGDRCGRDPQYAVVHAQFEIDMVAYAHLHSGRVLPGPRRIIMPDIDHIGVQIGPYGQGLL